MVMYTVSVLCPLHGYSVDILLVIQIQIQILELAVVFCPPKCYVVLIYRLPFT